MKDFSEWLDDLTGELQEPDDAPQGVCECEANPRAIGDIGNWPVNVQQAVMPHAPPPGAHSHSISVQRANMTATEVREAQEASEIYMRKQLRAKLMEASSILYDRYRRGRWQEGDENE